MAKFKGKSPKRSQFREIILETGAKFLLGKDKDSNDELMKKFQGKKNTIVHTIVPGSPFCVIEKQIFSGDVYAAGVLCARFSQDWRDNKKDVKIGVFTGKDIKKERKMKAGTWKVKKSRTITVKKQDILKLK